MELLVVGSGTVVPSGDRVCSAYFVNAGAAKILIDCGPGGTHHLARFDVPWSELTHLVVSHFHTDHIGGIPSLLFSMKHGLARPRTEPLRVLGPVGTRQLFDRLEAAFGEYITDPGFDVDIHEVGDEGVVELAGGVKLRAHATLHTDESQAYRLAADGGVLGYTGDTGPSEALGRFFQGTDLLIAECSLPDEEAFDMHLSPTTVAELARAARPGRLMLTHIFPPLARKDPEALVRAAGWDGGLVVAEDGLRTVVKE